MISPNKMFKMQRLKKISYDPACETLADHFLVDYPTVHPEARKDLAQTIQEAVEDWCAEHLEGS